jgi:hypothetical protein
MPRNQREIEVARELGGCDWERFPVTPRILDWMLAQGATHEQLELLTHDRPAFMRLLHNLITGSQGTTPPFDTW